MNLKNLWHRKDLTVGMLGSLIIKVVGTLLALSVSIFLARTMGLEAYGTYVLVFSIVMLLVVPLCIGFPLLLIRFVAKYELDNDKGALKGLILMTNKYTFFSFLIVSVICLLLLFLLRNVLEQEVLLTSAWGLALLPIMAFSALRASTLQGLRYVLLSQLPDIIIRNLLLITGLIFFSLKSDLSPSKAMAIHVVAALISYIVGYYFLKKNLLNELEDVTPVYHNKQWLNVSFKFALSMGVNILKTRFPTYLLALLTGTASVALFEVAFKTANVVSFTLTAVNSAVGPFFSRLFQQNNIKVLQRMVTKTTRLLFFVSFVIGLGLVLFGKEFIEIFYGAAYSDSYQAMIILGLAFLIHAAAGSVGLLLQMTGFEKFVLKINTINIFMAIIVGVVLIYFYGLIGAALAYASLVVIQNILFVIYARKNLKINTTIF